MKLDGKVAIVTGSARGIGETTAKKLASEGAAVVIDDINFDGACRVAEDINTSGSVALAFKADVTKMEEVRNMVDITLEKFGALHILVNNAGITRHKNLLETTEKDWDAVQEVCLKGVFMCTQAVLEIMMKQHYGKIVNISSLVALGSSNAGMANYAAAKAGVVALTKVTAREAGAYGINVNCIAPGCIVTQLTYARGKEAAEKFIEMRKGQAVLGRVGRTEDVANLVLYLVSDESSYMSGQIVRMDGGRTDLS